MSGQVHTVRVPLLERVLEANEETAASNRGELERRGIFAIDLIGSPGSGKTAILEATLRELSGARRAAVVVGDLATRRDGDRLARWCDQVVQVSTGQGCHLEAYQVREAFSRLSLDGVEILFIENVGNMICPVGFDLGQTAKVGLFAVTDGDDKAAKHPYLVEEADLLLLNKVDLLPYLPFDRALFDADVAQLNAGVPTLDVSATTGEGIGAWIAWLEAGVERVRAGRG